VIPALFVALLGIGAPPCQEGVAHEWEIEYADGWVESTASSSGELVFDERPYRDWRSRTRPVGGSSWSEWSRWVPAVPLLGDLNGSCSVTTADFNLLKAHLGEACPP